MLESKIQAAIIKKMTAKGWLVVKLIKTNLNGIPDLLCLKDNRSLFIEVKSEKGKLSEIQKYRINQLKNHGFEVQILNNLETFGND
jgi:Holliday junction resolvase